MLKLNTPCVCDACYYFGDDFASFSLTLMCLLQQAQDGPGSQFDSTGRR
jgi:hypothetical protein